MFKIQKENRKMNKDTLELIIKLDDDFVGLVSSLKWTYRVLKWKYRVLKWEYKELKIFFSRKYMELKWKGKEFEEMLEAIGPAEIKRFFKWKAKGLVESSDKVAKQENKEESTDELATTAYLAAILVFVLVGIIFNFSLIFS
jgi:hypothetical protein